MSGIGSFGINSTKVYGNSTTGPSITEHVVGDIGADRRGKWMFCLMGSAVTAYDCVQIGVAIGQTSTLATAKSTTTTLASTGPVRMGVAQTAFASGDYGWIWIGEGGGLGLGIKVNVLISCALGVKLYTTATAGALDDASTAGLIAGLGIVAAEPGSGTAAIECYSPIILGCNLNAA